MDDAEFDDLRLGGLHVELEAVTLLGDQRPLNVMLNLAGGAPGKDVLHMVEQGAAGRDVLRRVAEELGVDRLVVPLVVVLGDAEALAPGP